MDLVAPVNRLSAETTAEQDFAPRPAGRHMPQAGRIYGAQTAYSLETPRPGATYSRKYQLDTPRQYRSGRATSAAASARMDGGVPEYAAVGRLVSTVFNREQAEYECRKAL